MNKDLWIKRFEDKIHKFTDEEVKSAIGWTCCAVGSRIQLERPHLINDIGNKEIKLRKLLTPKALRLGVKFHEYVKDDNLEQAEKTFYKIQNLKTIFIEPNKHYFWWSKYT